MSYKKIWTWIYATRPHTLGASLAPMLLLLATTIKEGTLNHLPYSLALLVAVTAQIASNFANDYYDYKGGKDTKKRVGFRRLLTTGEVRIQEMKLAILITVGITILSGIVLSALQGWWLLLVGVIVILGVFAYSSGPYPLSHNGLGDLAVVIFYGLIPTLIGYYAVSTQIPPLYLLMFAFGIGIWEANIMVCNNYRDHDEDKESGKRTLVVRLGKNSGPKLYTLNALLTTLFLSTGIGLATESLWKMGVCLFFCFCFFIPMCYRITHEEGARLNIQLGITSILSVILSLLCLTLILC